MEELISVIVPVYNCEKYIESCIKSILEQDYSNLELILVDDGSTDKSGMLCNQYAARDKRIKVLSGRNSGASAARNKGMRVATGDWYSFVDADDFLDKNMYSTLMAFQKKTRAEIVQCGYRRIENGIEVFSTNSGGEYVQDTEEALMCLIEGKLFSNALWTKLFNKKVIDDISFNENLKINEDILFNFKAFMKAKKIAYIAQAKYNYIVHKNSTCFTIEDEKKLIDVCNVSKYILMNLKGSNIVGIARMRYLEMLILYFRFLYNKYGSCEQTKQVEKKIWQQSINKDIIGKKVVIIAALIHICPQLYCLLHGLYSRVKKPKWF